MQKYELGLLNLTINYFFLYLITLIKDSKLYNASNNNFI